MNVHAEFALAMAPLLAVSWAVTRQKQVAGTSFERATHTASARVSPGGNKGLDVAIVLVDNFDGTRPAGSTNNVDDAIASQSR